MTVLVLCPCCHGATYLAVHDEDGRLVANPMCCHCSGSGKVRSEVSEFENLEHLLRTFLAHLAGKSGST